MVRSRIPFLAHIPPPDRRRITAHAQHRLLDRGTALYLAGEPRALTYLVVSGAIKLVGRDARGNEAVLGLALPGDLVGAEAAIDGLPQPTDAIAAARTLVLAIDTTRLLDAMESDGRAAVAVARAVSTRLRWSYASTLERSARDAPARLASRLLELADALGRRCGDAIEVDLPMARTDLAGLAGMCRESASKAMGALRREGVLDFRGRRIRILRPDLLDRISSEGLGGARGP
jgi:CRP-like cAMP-binding protein